MRRKYGEAETPNPTARPAGGGVGRWLVVTEMYGPKAGFPDNRRVLVSGNARDGARIAAAAEIFQGLAAPPLRVLPRPAWMRGRIDNPAWASI